MSASTAYSKHTWGPYDLRITNLVQPKRQPTTYGMRSFSYLGSRLWNELEKDWLFFCEMISVDSKNNHSTIGWSKSRWRFLLCLILYIFSLLKDIQLFYHIWISILFYRFYKIPILLDVNCLSRRNSGLTSYIMSVWLFSVSLVVCTYLAVYVLQLYVV